MPILAKRLVSNCDTNLLMTISTFEEVAVLSVVQSRCDLRRHCLHKSLVDHSFTTDRCGNNGDCTSRKFWKRRCSEQKRLKTNGNYYKKHKKSLGKDEVGGSNPPSSSRKSCFLSKTGLFLYFSVDLIRGSGVGSTLTHTVTHTRKCPDRSKEYRRGGFTSSPVLFVLFLLT